MRGERARHSLSLRPAAPVIPFVKPLTDLEDIIEHRRDLLTKYQNSAYADRYERDLFEVDRY